MTTPLPEPAVLNTHTPTGIKIYGYTDTQMRQYAADETKRLTAKLQEMTAERDALKADAERMNWLERNLYNRENLTMFDKVDPDYNMWVLFAPVGVQGSARAIIDAAMKGKA